MHYIWHQNCVLCEREVTLLDDKLLIRLLDDIEASDGLTEEDKDIMRKLAKKAAEIESEARNSD